MVDVILSKSVIFITFDPVIIKLSMLDIQYTSCISFRNFNCNKNVWNVKTSQKSSGVFDYIQHHVVMQTQTCKKKNVCFCCGFCFVFKWSICKWLRLKIMRRWWELGMIDGVVLTWRIIKSKGSHVVWDSLQLNSSRFESCPKHKR